MRSNILPGKGQCKLRLCQSKQKHGEDDCQCCHCDTGNKELKLPQPLNYETSVRGIGVSATMAYIHKAVARGAENTTQWKAG